MTTETAPVRLGEYRLVRRIGKGGMGEVFEAVHGRLGTTVALKVLNPFPPGSAPRERFLREARIGARMRHPGIVRVRDLDLNGPRPYLVMDYIAGRSLEEELSGGPIEPSRAIEIARRVAETLAAAHEKGIVHRDVKPANILLGDDGGVYVADFGLSHLVEEGRRLTRTGALLGTAPYMAPEQISAPSDELDGRADVHALGTVLYEMLTGTSPFRGTDFYETLQNVEALEPPPPSALAPGIPSELDAVIHKALAKRKEDRFAGAAEMAAALRSKRQIPWRAGLLLLAACLAGIAAALLVRAL